ncbi:MAG: MarR family transcriptional regulator [Pseudomonadota bacterium]|nr:MarR family transcriptional regulator [Pseudomonadota bacterium]
MQANVAAENQGDLSLDDRLCFALYAATHAITRAYRPLLSELGITYPQYLVLLVLWEQDTVPVGEIARRLQLDAAALTPLVKRLEALGLVTRQRDARDERIVRITLSSDGQGLRARAAEVQAEVALRTGLPYGEIASLRSRLQQLSQALCEDSRIADAA